MKTRYKNDIQKQAAYENACDCLCYGFGQDVWNSCGLDEQSYKEVWKQAFEDMANEYE